MTDAPINDTRKAELLAKEVERAARFQHLLFALAHARARLRSDARKHSPETDLNELTEIRLLLDKGHSVEAQSRLAALVEHIRQRQDYGSARNQPVVQTPDGLQQKICAAEVRDRNLLDRILQQNDEIG